METSVSDMMGAFVIWRAGDTAARSADFHGYVRAIAQARHVIRKVLRIVDEQARAHGLEPMQHQALLQVYGTDEELPISRIAERLDVVPAFASRLLRKLEEMGLVRRLRLSTDRRVTIVSATPAGVERLRVIDNAVQVHVNYFQSQLSDEDRLDALAIFAFYVGLEPGSNIAAAIRDSLAPAAEELRSASRGRRRPRSGAVRQSG